MNNKPVTFLFSEESYEDLENLAENLNTSIDKVIGKGIALLKMAQGRKVTLSDQKGSFDITNFTDLPSRINIKKK